MGSERGKREGQARGGSERGKREGEARGGSERGKREGEARGGCERGWPYDLHPKTDSLQNKPPTGQQLKRDGETDDLDSNSK